ncbi:MAG: GAF domain-containing protein [Bacteroidales bacterium]
MKFTIGRKLSLGFSILIVFFLLSIAASYVITQHIKKINFQNSTIYVPSMRELMEFNNLIVESEKLIGNWIFIQSYDDTSDKNKLRNIVNEDYPALKQNLVEIAENFRPEDRDSLSDVFVMVDELFVTYNYVMNQLSNFESYDDPMVLFEIRPMMEQGGEIVESTQDITQKLESLIQNQQERVKMGQVRLQNTLDNFTRMSFLIGVVLVIGGIIISFIFIRIISKPVIYLRDILNVMGKGKIPEENIKAGNDEIGDMGKALNFLIEGLKEKAIFAREIGQGNFEHNYKPLSDDDTLGLSLMEMRESLRKAKQEEENRKIEDKKRNWATQGIAQFADLLRQNNDNLKDLSFNIIKNMVNYLDANQGGVFILEDEGEEVYVELAACYAFERRKFLQKKIMKGEGLVGTCLQEGETIFITEVPENYISITSGLGDSNPRSILIVPLKLNDEIFGVIEIASFKVFDPYQIEFVEKVAESIASTISSVKINIRTTELLHQSQEQSEEMRAQEEEMRQNMEEMHATQEEMERKEIESQGFYDVVNTSVPFMELSVDCNIKKLNPVFCELTGFSEFQADSLGFYQVFDKSFLENNGFSDIQNTLSAGNSVDGVFKITKNNGELLTLKGGFKPILNKYGAPSKIVFIVYECK